TCQRGTVMDPNTLSIHYSVRDNDEDKILDQSRIVIPKTKGFRKKVEFLRSHIISFFKGGKDD
ncbi:MAG: hypothetical protein QW393_03035, partial [Candidatus Micrarchaeaceae archaeon]